MNQAENGDETGVSRGGGDGLGRRSCVEHRGDGCREVLRDRVIPAMSVELTSRTFFFYVGDFSARRQLAVPADYASTRERSKTQ